MTDAPQFVDARRRAGWLPGDLEGLEKWLERLVERVDARPQDAERHPVIVEMGRRIDADALLRMRFERMLAEEPQSKPYRRRHVRDVDHLLRLLDELLTRAPEFSEDSTVMTPVEAVLDWAVSTPSGFAAFRDPEVNELIAAYLRAWCDFLTSRESLYVLNDSPTGWRSEAARAAVGMDQFEHDPDAEDWGFSS
ncbi:phophatidylserine decarboxylase associated domain-containing protein [Kineococcus sp. SYSU DK001]|uniref:phophatidylserine decarboxylase associated domain-containing protein n=1 Tax=Kineococcus sp. SYSU DK001 TaxID=3383122 RepID=UPI003D7E7356